MDTISIEFDVAPSAPQLPLTFSVELDGQQVWHSNALTEAARITIPVADTDGEQHSLKWIVSNKTPQHTKLDANGNIVEDSVVRVHNLQIDGIDMSEYLYTFATYTHDCNGTTEQRVEPMYQDLGCNGVAELAFSTPIYLWLLEKM